MKAMGMNKVAGGELPERCEIWIQLETLRTQRR